MFSRFLGKTNLLFPHHLNFLDFRHNISLTHSRTDLLAENSCSRTDLLELADEPNTIVANDGKVVVLTSNFIYVLCSILCASIHRLQGYIFWPLPTTSPPPHPLEGNKLLTKMNMNKKKEILQWGEWGNRKKGNKVKKREK